MAEAPHGTAPGAAGQGHRQSAGHDPGLRGAAAPGRARVTGPAAERASRAIYEAALETDRGRRAHARPRRPRRDHRVHRRGARAHRAPRSRSGPRCKPGGAGGAGARGSGRARGVGARARAARARASTVPGTGDAPRPRSRSDHRGRGRAMPRGLVAIGSPRSRSGGAPWPQSRSGSPRASRARAVPRGLSRGRTVPVAPGPGDENTSSMASRATRRMFASPGEVYVRRVVKGHDASHVFAVLRVPEPGRSQMPQVSLQRQVNPRFRPGPAVGYRTHVPFNAHATARRARARRRPARRPV